MTEPPPHVAVAICTFRRPRGLADCLAALERLDTPGLPDAAIRVIVVDNSPEGSAQDIVAGRARASRFRIERVHEPRKGLSSARNAALDAAFACGARHLAFIDDDEVPSPPWLSGHLETLAASGAEASVGPVRPIFAEPPPLWAVEGGFFSASAPAGMHVVPEGRTNNALLSCAALQAAGIRFDRAFDDLGGEDTAFFRALQARGWTIALAHDALVHEWIPMDRVRVAWLARRWFRTGGVEARLSARGHTGAGGRIVNAARGLVRIGAGSLLVAGHMVTGGRSARSRALARLTTVCRGAGLLASALGVEHREYATPKAEERLP